MMKKLLLLGLAIGLDVAPMMAQPVLNHQDPVVETHQQGGGMPGFNPMLQPFYHGVASGDPLPDAVIIWTHVTPDSTMTVTGTWDMALDTSFSQIVQSGTFSTDETRDYNVKLDVGGLQPNTTYYYRFSALGSNSLTGRTKTAPTGNMETHLRFAAVTCEFYTQGFFNAHGRIADRNDLNAVIMLGDYIYEYAGSGVGRQHQPYECVTLEQYRERYSLYHVDPDLIRDHQQHPFITIWDDHETANNAWMYGAQNHNPATQGDWLQRKAAARQAYFEWLPIRDNPDSLLRRTLHYGDLCDIIVTDTRIEGRELQVYNIGDPNVYHPDRTMLGAAQRAWFFDELDHSTARWKVIANGVVFAQFNVGWWGPLQGQAPSYLESIYLDLWDGYPAERQKILRHLDSAGVDNVVYLTGDIHNAFAFDLPDTACLELTYDAVPNYDRLTGAGSKAVEFVVPSISSSNFKDRFGPATAADLEARFMGIEGDSMHFHNPHLKYASFQNHGYLLLDLKPDSAQGNYYYVPRVDTPMVGEFYGGGAYARDGENHLMVSNAESPPRATQDIPAPALPTLITSMPTVAAEAALLNVYPKPAADFIVLQYALEKMQPVFIEIVDMKGVGRKIIANGLQSPGVYRMEIGLNEVPAGAYTLVLRTATQQLSQQILVVK